MKLTGTSRWFPQIVQWESISNIYITKIVVLVSEPVRGRSRATELPCFRIRMADIVVLRNHAQRGLSWNVPLYPNMK